MKLLVTGGSGFLGSRLLPALVREGHQVIALARSADAARIVQDRGATPRMGDLLRLDLDLSDIDAVVHAAAHFRLAGPRKPFFQNNVEGTRALIEVSRKASIRRLVYVSAAAVVMDDAGSPLNDIDESAPTFSRSRSAYIASKAQAEGLLLHPYARALSPIVLRPPGIWGTGDAFSRALPSLVTSRQFRFVDRGDYPYVTCHVDNVVEAIQRAISAPDSAAGRAYFINDSEPTRFRDFVSGIGGALGLDLTRTGSISYGAARTIGGVMENVWSMMGRGDDPPMSRTMVRLIGRPFVTRDDRARKLLGYVGARTRASGLAGYRQA